MPLTIDGKKFSYRDPKNGNEHSYDWTNPLYDFSKSSVKEAAGKLGIKNVDEKEEVSSIVDWLENRNKNNDQKRAQAKAEPEPEQKQLPPRGSTFREDRQTYEETRLQRPENQAPRMEFTDRPNQDAIRHGEDLNAHYINKFIPSLEADARLTAQEIGESGRFNLNRFIGKVPELGDPKDMFAYYSKQLTENA